MTAALPASRRALLALLAVAVPLIAACERATEPSVVPTEVALREASVDPTTMWDSTAAFVIVASVVDTLAPLAFDRRVLASITTSHGDRESIHLSRFFCTASWNTCHTIGIGLRSGADFGAVRRAIEPLGARITTISLSRLYANVFVSDPAAVSRVVRALARQRHVESVTRDAVGFCGLSGCAPGPAFFAMLRGGLPFRARTNQPAPFDGYLEIQPGDTIRLAVTQPDGSTLRHEHVVPPWMPGGPSSVYAP